MFGLFSKKGNKMSMEKAKIELENDASILLVDVRTSEEYNSGHLPNSINLPLDVAHTITQVIENKDAKIFVYCLSGARSETARQMFTKLGYTDVTNIGGIQDWTGAIEK